MKTFRTRKWGLMLEPFTIRNTTGWVLQFGPLRIVGGV